MMAHEPPALALGMIAFRVSQPRRTFCAFVCPQSRPTRLMQTDPYYPASASDKPGYVNQNGCFSGRHAWWGRAVTCPFPAPATHLQRCVTQMVYPLHMPPCRGRVGPCGWDRSAAGRGRVGADVLSWSGLTNAVHS